VDPALVHAAVAAAAGIIRTAGPRGDDGGMAPVQAPPRSLLAPLTIRGRGRSVTFPVAALLAPMDGITDPAFRGLVLDLGDAGGAVTEFLRLSSAPIGGSAIRRELGLRRPPVPVGIQFMTPGVDHLAVSVQNASQEGADWIDLNFGCPAKRVFNRCAGSALLADPGKVEAIVAEAVSATDLPVSAKVRAGIDDDAHLEEVLDAAASGGAAMVTLHARLRRDSYAAPARWEWIARAAEFLRARHPSVVLLGNGGIDSAGDARRMAAETGCDGVMVGRAAFADPFIFRRLRGGPPAGPAEAAGFALRYMDAVLAPGALRGGAGKVKQFVRYTSAGGFFEGREEERVALLRSPGTESIRTFFSGCLEAPAPDAPSPLVDGTESPEGRLP